MPFHIACAVSPFKYNREDCLYQYPKLEKKIAAGANLAITQVGWDARKFAELKRYMDERGLQVPLLGNVYVLNRRAAEKMASGTPPGCWAAPELVEQIRKESEAADGGLSARLERAAKTVAVLRGSRLRRRLHRRHPLARRRSSRSSTAPRSSSRSGRSVRRSCSLVTRMASTWTPHRRSSHTARSSRSCSTPPARPYRSVGERRARHGPSAQRQAILRLDRRQAGVARSVRAVRVPGPSARSSGVKRAATACSATWSTSVPRPVRSRCEMARAAAR